MVQAFLFELSDERRHAWSNFASRLVDYFTINQNNNLTARIFLLSVVH